METFLSYKIFKKIKNKNNKNNKNKIAIITGGVGRIGSIFTNELLHQNCKVLCLSRSEKKFSDYKKKLPTTLRNKIDWMYFDLSKIQTVSQIIKKVKKKFNKIDYLINCAMHSYRGKNFKYSEDNLIEEINGVYASSFFLTENLLPLLRRNKLSKIINVGSIWGTNAPHFETYLEMDIGPSANIAAGKAAIMQYTKYLVSRESKNGIIINNLIPGWFPRKGKIERKDYLHKICKNIPLSRIGKLEDLVPAISFLLSNNNNYFSGQNLYVDGGYTVF